MSSTLTGGGGCLQTCEEFPLKIFAKMGEIKIRVPSEQQPPVISVANKVAQEPCGNGDAATYVDADSCGNGDAMPYVDADGCEKPSKCFFLPTLRPRISLLQKVGAEVISTFILVFAGCGAVMADVKSHGQVTHVGISLAFGLVITIMIYAVGHISGAHMNPAVTIAFATARHFPWSQVPVYICAQCGGSIVASFVLRLILSAEASEGATLPAGSDVQSFVLEIIITFILMFVVSAVATDTRAVGELAGIAVGSAVALNALMAGPISGASMNPARSIGPAVASANYRAIWVYIAGPVIGAVAGALAYNMIRLPNKDMSDKPSKSFRR